MPEYRAIMPTSSIKIRRIAPYNYRTRHASIEAYDVSKDLGDIVLADTHSGYFVTDRGKDILAKLGGDFLEYSSQACGLRHHVHAPARRQADYTAST
jgi:hypothetical protein